MEVCDADKRLFVASGAIMEVTKRVWEVVKTKQRAGLKTKKIVEVKLKFNTPKMEKK